MARQKYLGCGVSSTDDFTILSRYSIVKYLKQRLGVEFGAKGMPLIAESVTTERATRIKIQQKNPIFGASNSRMCDFPTPDGPRPKLIGE